MSEDAHGGQKRVAELLDLQLQEVVLSLLLLVQVTDPGFSARAAISLTPQASPALGIGILKDGVQPLPCLWRVMLRKGQMWFVSKSS